MCPCVRGRFAQESTEQARRSSKFDLVRRPFCRARTLCDVFGNREVPPAATTSSRTLRVARCFYTLHSRSWSHAGPEPPRTTSKTAVRIFAVKGVPLTVPGRRCSPSLDDALRQPARKHCLRGARVSRHPPLRAQRDPPGCGERRCGEERKTVGFRRVSTSAGDGPDTRAAFPGYVAARESRGSDSRDDVPAISANARCFCASRPRL